MTKPQTIGDIFAQEEAEAVARFKATPPEQLKAEAQARAARLEADAARTPTETTTDEQEETDE